jgi:hypothetical protein
MRGEGKGEVGFTAPRLILLLLQKHYQPIGNHQ